MSPAHLALAAALALFTACGERAQKTEPEPEPWRGPPPVTEVEKRRGLAACADYKRRVCACAKTDPGKAADCRMADSRIGALELSLRIAAAEREAGGASPDGDDNDSSRALAISNARKVMRRCIEQVAQLARGCPTPTPAEAD